MAFDTQAISLQPFFDPKATLETILKGAEERVSEKYEKLDPIRAKVPGSYLSVPRLLSCLTTDLRYLAYKDQRGVTYEAADKSTQEVVYQVESLVKDIMEENNEVLANLRKRIDGIVAISPLSKIKFYNFGGPPPLAGFL